MTYTPRDPLLTTEQAAEYLGVKPHTIKNWRARGAMPEPVKLNHLVRWKLSSLEAFAGQSSEPEAA